MGHSLVSGSRVCIIGGGPAGSFAALHLLRGMKERNLDLEVWIFEPRDFNRPGPGGCNKCAGILSSRLMKGLQILDLSLPEQVVQARVQSYAVHLDGEYLSVSNPDPDREIVSTYRGAGPRMIKGDPVASFDHYLLEQACARGARHIPSRVRRVIPAERPIIRTAHESIPADLIVLATGVNSRAPLDERFGYQSPKTAVMAQDEFLLPTGWPVDQVSAHFGQPRGLIFGAMIPKGKYLNVSLLGKGLSTDAVSDFIEGQGFDESFQGPPGSLCGCTPRIAIGAASKVCGPRWVAVGDAAVSRLYKDGIGSAFYSSQLAIDVALRTGISGSAFRRHYAPYCRRISRDNRYGRFLFAMWAVTYRNRLLRDIWKGALQAEAGWQQERRVHNRILWSMLTGDDAYRDLFWLSISREALQGLWKGLRISLAGKIET